MSVKASRVVTRASSQSHISPVRLHHLRYKHNLMSAVGDALGWLFLKPIYTVWGSEALRASGGDREAKAQYDTAIKGMDGVLDHIAAHIREMSLMTAIKSTATTTNVCLFTSL